MMSVDDTDAPTLRTMKRGRQDVGGLQRLLDEAEYEINQDPYRGVIACSQAPPTGPTSFSPWRRCCWSATDDDNESIEHDPNQNGTPCPALTAWKADGKSANGTKPRQKGRKRKQLNGPSNPQPFVWGRPKEPAYECRCDYNPVRGILLVF